MSETTNIVPFGKYKGQPIDVLRQDQDYLEWLSQQDWFRKKFAALYNMLLTEPSETPEHNRYQALFLDQAFAAVVFDKLYPGEREKNALNVRKYKFSEDHGLDELVEEKRRLSERLKHHPDNSDALKTARNNLNPVSEKLRGVIHQWTVLRAQPIDPAELSEIIIEFETRVTIPSPSNPYGQQRFGGKQSGTADVQMTAANRAARIEIKPAMGDDYPAVLRQMKASHCNVLYLVAYTGEGATLDQVKQIFQASGITVLMHDAVTRSRLLD